MAQFIINASEYSSVFVKVIDRWLSGARMPDWVFSKDLGSCVFFEDHVFFEAEGLSCLQEFEKNRASPERSEIFLVSDFRSANNFFSKHGSYPALRFGVQEDANAIARKIYSGPSDGCDIRAGYSEALYFSSSNDWFVFSDRLAEISVFASVSNCISRQFKNIASKHIVDFDFEEVLCNLIEPAIRPEMLDSYRSRLRIGYSSRVLG